MELLRTVDEYMGEGVMYFDTSVFLLRQTEKPFSEENILHIGHIIFGFWSVREAIFTEYPELKPEGVRLIFEDEELFNELTDLLYFGLDHEQVGELAEARRNYEALLAKTDGRYYRIFAEAGLYRISRACRGDDETDPDGTVQLHPLDSRRWKVFTARRRWPRHETNQGVDRMELLKEADEFMGEGLGYLCGAASLLRQSEWPGAPDALKCVADIVSRAWAVREAIYADYPDLKDDLAQQFKEDENKFHELGALYSAAHNHEQAGELAEARQKYEALLAKTDKTYYCNLAEAGLYRVLRRKQYDKVAAINARVKDNNEPSEEKKNVRDMVIESVAVLVAFVVMFIFSMYKFSSWPSKDFLSWDAFNLAAVFFGFPVCLVGIVFFVKHLFHKRRK